MSIGTPYSGALAFIRQEAKHNQTGPAARIFEISVEAVARRLHAAQIPATDEARREWLETDAKEGHWNYKKPIDDPIIKRTAVQRLEEENARIHALRENLKKDRLEGDNE